jgi:hypothetical protein
MSMQRSLSLMAATLGLALAAAGFGVAAQAASTPGAGLVTQDQVALRNAPRDAAPMQTLLWRGEALELRGERGDYLQVWDHHRERGGYVRKGQVQRIDGLPASELLAVLAFVRDTPGAEAMGLGLAAAAISATTPAQMAGPQGAAALDALGSLAERLADRASANTALSNAAQAALSAHLDVAARYGVRLPGREVDGRVLLCYDGDAHRRLLALPAATPEQKARAALALSRPDCLDPAATPTAREQALAQQAQWLDRVPVADLPPHWQNRLALRRASLWASLAFARSRRGEAAAGRLAAEHALADMAGVQKAELADDDVVRWTEAALRVNAVRWAASNAVPGTGLNLKLSTTTAADGQTCVSLADARTAKPLVQRCTWGVVWAASAQANAAGTALALAVQPTEAWRELWVFQATPSGWVVQVLPPAAAVPGVGYAEWAGWVPGGQQMLVVREAVAEGRSTRRFELTRIDTLVAERTALDAEALGAFKRWPDAAWKRDTLALR